MNGRNVVSIGNESTGRAPLLLGVAALAGLIAGCGSGGGGGGSSARMTIVEASNGFGRLLPHQVARRDAAGLPTSQILEVRSFETLRQNVTLTNPILPPTEWRDVPELPTGEAGNHFLYVRFSQPIDVDSVMDGSTGAIGKNNLRGSITIVATNPATGETTTIPGRAFIGGMTYGSVDPDDPTRLVLERWIGLQDGQPVALEVNGERPGLGFPGTEGTFAGAADLVSPRTFVFVPDANDDLDSTVAPGVAYETFPRGVQIRMTMTRGVLSTRGEALEEEGLASTTVGPDGIAPEVLVSGASNTPVIIPGNGDVDVDPSTHIVVEFTEPVQIVTVGDLPGDAPPTLSSAIQVQFGPSTNTVTVPFSVRPVSVYDLSRLELVPAYGFPGSGPSSGAASCGAFSEVRVVVNPDQLQDLASTPNANTIAAETSFTTGEGAGIVNAPVTPDAIYVARGGSRPGLSVIDLNGFGGSTGNPSYDDLDPVQEGNSNFPNNPNVALQGSLLVPPLARGTCTLNGGSAGVFTLTRDSALSDLLATTPVLESAGDMALGHSLDNTFNNALPFGCQAGGGNICAASGFKLVQISPGGANTQVPSTVSTAVPIQVLSGAENMVAWAPHPNPPPLAFPPLCISPQILGVEPTSITSPVANLLAPGTPFGDPVSGIPPQGLLTLEQNAFFEGPHPPTQNINTCGNFMMRQQVGQFLYVIDRVAAQVVVLNSNRFTVIERIPLPDPTSLAMSPNLEFLAVTNQLADVVSVVDTNPASATFHEVVKTIRVGHGPTGIAWEPGNEDIFVCNRSDSSVSILSAFTLEVRKTLTSQISSPIDVAITPRQIAFGFSRAVYFAYILNGDGSLAIFESGPNGLNGWGYDDVIGQPPFRFANPKAIQADVTNLNSGVWVVHENQLGTNGQPTGRLGGAITNVTLASAQFGVIPLSTQSPSLRDMEWRVQVSVGSDQLTGVPSDIAFDDLRMQTSLRNYATQFSAGFPVAVNGKSLVKPLTVGVAPVSAPQYLFVSVPNSTEGPGAVDVLSVASGFQRFDTDPFRPGVQSIAVPGAIGLMDFVRQ